MRMMLKLPESERKRQDRSVRRAAKGGRITKVTLIRGPIHPHSSALTTAVEAESANLLIWRQDQAQVTSSGRPLGECRLRIYFSSENQRLFLYYFRSPFGRAEIEERSTGNQESMRNIGQERIKNIVVPICSPAEQAEITRILDTRLTAADRMEAEIDAALSRADVLRQSILKRAFAGNLVPQDPSDEPAPTLLARIKAERAKATKSKTKRTTA